MEQRKMAIYFRTTREKRLNLDGIRGTKMILGNMEDQKKNIFGEQGL